jgi:hypothetical protein
MLIKFLRRHLSYEPNSVHDIEDEVAFLYVRNGLAVPAESKTPPPVVTVDEGMKFPDPIVTVLVKNKGGRPPNKPRA